MWRHYIKCKDMFMFSLKKIARKGLTMLQEDCTVLWWKRHLIVDKDIFHHDDNRVRFAHITHIRWNYIKTLWDVKHHNPIHQLASNHTILSLKLETISCFSHLFHLMHTWNLWWDFFVSIYIKRCRDWSVYCNVCKFLQHLAVTS